MDKKKLLKDVASGIGKATLWTAKQTTKGTAKAAEYAYDHRAEIGKGVSLAANAVVEGVLQRED